MKKLGLLALAVAVAGGTFVLAKKQSCGSCCNDTVQESSPVAAAGGNSGGDRVASGR